MVNKTHPPRSSKGSKKPAVAGLNGEDTSFIVFGDEKRSKKPKATGSNDTNVSTASGSKTKTSSGPSNTPDEASKKPDTRTLIAGASWTGKLPMTLFNELCQKQKWERPEYLVDRNAKGFIGKVVIRRKHPKTQEVTQLPPIALPKSFPVEKAAQPTSIEAKHYAAAYALFRVRNATSLYTTLPPQYRDLWKEDWKEVKEDAVRQGHGYQFEADPFLGFKQHEDAKAAAEKSKADMLKQKAAEQKTQIVGMDGRVQDKHSLKGWQKVPKVEMGSKTRMRIESLVRSARLWNPHNVQLSPPEQADIVKQLANSGFRKSHVEEATGICKDKEECLEWLLIHVPEDDLPGWALPENYVAGISLAGDIKREHALKRLTAGGYSRDLCLEVLDSCAGDESAAAFALQQRLVGSNDSIAHADDEGFSVWDEELQALEAIFGDRFTNHDRICTIRLDLQTPTKKPITLRARPPPHSYPRALPTLVVEAELPAYIRLSITKRCLYHAQSSLLGDQMLFNIIDWLENETNGIIADPGRLAEIANVVASSLTDTSDNVVRKVKTQRHPRPITWTENGIVSRRMQEEHASRQSQPEQQRMLQTRQSLPAWKLQQAIVQSVTQNQVTIISGETGSGKSTQSVQFILDDLISRGLGEHANIICTQPRRISALGLADRVANERCTIVGDEVGFAIRGETKQKTGVTKICFVTTGVLLRRLQTSGGSVDEIIKSIGNVSHIVIDEVHERSLDTDFLLILIRDVLQKRKDLKLVLMSATLDSATFEKYFRGRCTVGKVEIAGRTYPVTDIYLEEIAIATGFGDLSLRTNDGDEEQTNTSAGRILKAVGMRINYELIAETVRGIDSELGSQNGGILIFLPGLAEIDQTIKALRNDSHLHVLPLHASLQSSEQRRVFQRAPAGKRKVVAATNVAETSITIDDIVAVIDTGKVKETSFDPANNMVKLAEVWASQAACKQRRGRAGRVQAGKCYKLYTREAESKMNARPDPEILRVPLAQLCLSVRAMGIANVEEFLASALTPPQDTAVGGAMTLLRRIGALDGQELTALGRHLSLIPADLRLAKLMVYGAAFGCLEACLTIAAILTARSPFISPRERRDEARAARLQFGSGNGDLIVDLNAYDAWSEKKMEGLSSASLRRWCDENYLNQQTLIDIRTNRTQFLSSLKEIGFLSSSHTGYEAVKARDDSVDSLLRALIAGAFQPQIARIEFPDKKYAASSSGTIEVDPEARTIKYYDEDTGRVFIHPSSILFGAQAFPGDGKFMSYFTKMATSKIFIRDLTPFNIYSLLMFSGPITIDPQGRGLVVDGWLRVRGWARIGVLTSRLRMMLDDLLGSKIEDPGLDLIQSPVVDCVRRLILLNGMDV